MTKTMRECLKEILEKGQLEKVDGRWGGRWTARTIKALFRDHKICLIDGGQHVMVAGQVKSQSQSTSHTSGHWGDCDCCDCCDRRTGEEEDDDEAERTCADLCRAARPLGQR